jgi:hypothetical protein
MSRGFWGFPVVFQTSLAEKDTRSLKIRHGNLPMRSANSRVFAELQRKSPPEKDLQSRSFLAGQIDLQMFQFCRLAELIQRPSFNLPNAFLGHAHFFPNFLER